MMLYKSCPKCHGDLGLERDVYGGPPDLVCIQCGYTARPQERISLMERLMQGSPRQLRPAPAYARAATPQRRAS